MRDAIEDFFSGWGLLILIAAGVGFTVLGFNVESAGSIEGPVLAVALPVLVTVIPLLAALGRSNAGKVIPIGLALLAAGASEYAVYATMYPSAPDAEVDVITDEAGGTELDVPSGALEVSAHFELGNSNRADYRIEIERGGESRTVKGKFTREVRHARRRRGGRTSTLVVHETDRHEIDLPGTGPARITAHGIEAGTKMHVSFRSPNRWPFRAALFCLGMFVLAAVYDATTDKRDRTHLATGAAIAGAFAFTIVRRFSPDARFSFMFGTTALALIVGAAGGWIGTGLVRGIFFRNLSESPRKRSTESSRDQPPEPDPHPGV